MADEKISAMPAALTLANADIVPVVQAGANKKCSRALFLRAAVGESITMSDAGNLGSYHIDSDGTLTIGILGVALQLTSDGNFKFFGVPTADPGISGALWNNLGVLTLSP